MKIRGIPSNEIENWWHFVDDFIEMAVKRSHDRYTLESIKECLLNKSMQLWVTTEDNMPVGAGTTYITNYPNKTVCTMNFYGGKMPTETLGIVEGWAKENGCVEVEVIGRKGWERVLPGYKQIHTIISKEV